MRFGIYVPSYGAYGDPAVLTELAVRAESAGWDGFFLYDLIGPLDDRPPVADPWVVLGAIAQVTSTIRLGPMVVPVPRRRPWKLALEASTLQRLSGGRAILGVGAGVGPDYSRFGESAKKAELASRLDEGTSLVRRLLAGGTVDYSGTHYRVDGARFAATDVPIWTSGFWPRSVPVRAAQDAEGLFPQIRDPEDDFRLPTPDEVGRIREEFVDAGGRPDADLAIWSEGTRLDSGAVSAYEEAGATWWFESVLNDSPADFERHIAAGPPRTGRPIRSA